MKPTLLVLAAGVGSRYGSLKQMDPVGPGGETLIDYSIFDCIRAGFGRIVFVIRPEIESEFRHSVGRRIETHLPVEYCSQKLDMIPGGHRVHPDRRKPWGTGHAVLAARRSIDENFAVINADDFYGINSFRALASHLETAEDDDHGNYSMVGFTLRQTLSEHGSVARGVCRNHGGFLKGVVELTQIERIGKEISSSDPEGRAYSLSGEEIVSLNMWGFTPSIFVHLEKAFVSFLEDQGQNENSEFFIPTVVNKLITTGRAKVRVLTTNDSWFGMTYRKDLSKIKSEIRNLVICGSYPKFLWNSSE